MLGETSWGHDLHPLNSFECNFWLVWNQFWKGAPVMFSEVQPEAQESEALIWTGHQQHQEMLYYALWGRKLVSKTSDASDGWQLLVEALPDISGPGCGAGTASLGLSPGTPGSFFSPQLPARPSLPIDPESNTCIRKHIYRLSVLTSELAIIPPPLSAASLFHIASGARVPPGLSGTESPGHSGTQWSGQILPLTGLKETKERKKIRQMQILHFFSRFIRCELYPAVIVQQTSGDDGVQKHIMSSDYVVKILSPLHFVPELIPGAF